MDYFKRCPFIGLLKYLNVINSYMKMSSSQTTLTESADIQVTHATVRFFRRLLNSCLGRGLNVLRVVVVVVVVINLVVVGFLNRVTKGFTHSVACPIWFGSSCPGRRLRWLLFARSISFISRSLSSWLLERNFDISPAVMYKTKRKNLKNTSLYMLLS